MKKIGVLGAGSMGSGIAQVASTAGHEVVLFDVNSEALAKTKGALQKILARLVEKGRVEEEESKAILERIKFVDNMQAFADCDLIIEAIIENLDVKRKVFGELESIVSDDCVLASNTSSLSIDLAKP